MYKRFTDRARKVMQLANQEAQRFQHRYIGSEHILLGLAKEGSGVAVNVVKDLGVEPRTITRDVETFLLGDLPAGDLGEAPQPPRAKRVVQYAMDEARDLNHDYVGTEHILLGLLRDDVGLAIVVLMNLGLRLEKVRAEVRATLQRAESEGSTAYSPQSRIQWGGDEAKCHVYPLDDETKNRARQLVGEVAALRQAKEDAVANQEFRQASQLRDKEDEKRGKLAALVPSWVRRNIERAAEARPAKHSRYPLLDMLRDEAGEPDAGVLSVLPNPLMPPVKIVVGTIPRFPISTVKALLAPDDIGSPYFQALVPLISPESVARAKKDHSMMVRVAFHEIGWAGNPSRGHPVLLCVVRPTLLSQDVRDEVFAGLRRTNCDFVVFEAGTDAHSLLGNLPPGTTLLEPGRRT